MDITEATRKKTRIGSKADGSIELLAPQPFQKGHVLDETEAAVLNQTFIENLSNNLRSAVTKAIKDAGGSDKVDVAALQEQLDKYAEEYSFGQRRTSKGGSKVADPVEKKYLALVREFIKDNVLKKVEKEFTKEDGSKETRAMTFKDLDQEAYDKLFDAVEAKHGPTLRKQAEEFVATSQAAAADVADLTNLI